MSESVALARKWRPRLLAEMSGQAHVVRALSNALSQGRVHHAYLFTGARGVGKTTLARILAKAFNCESGVSAEPCLNCDSCRAIEAGGFVDVLEMDAASHTKVEEMHEVLESAVYLPSRGRHKIFIIDEVHMLSKHAFNAMLKTLEEPPPHVKFILATTDPQKLPPTVLSRCLRFGLKLIPRDDIAKRLREVLSAEKLKFDEDGIAALSRLARGSLRDALSLLDQSLAYGGGEVRGQEVREMVGDAGADSVRALAFAVVEKNAQAARKIIDEMQSRAASFDSAISDLAEVLHLAALSRAFPDAVGDDKGGEEDSLAVCARELSGRLSAEQMQVLFEIAIRSRESLPNAPDERIGFEMAILRMMLFASDSPAESPMQNSGEKNAIESSPPPPPSLSNSESESSADSEWARIIEDFPRTARLLAKHCEVKSRDDSGIVLAVESAGRNMIKFSGSLTGELKKRFGDNYRVEIESDNGGGMSTVAGGERRKMESRMRIAEEAIKTDPFVRELTARIEGAKVVSVRPIEE